MASPLFHRILLCLTLCTVSLATGSGAHGGEVTEEKLKALFLVNALGYVEWQGRPKPATYGVCAAASDEFTVELRSHIQLKGLDARVRLRNLDVDRDLDGCDVLYVENDTVRGAGFLLKEAREKRLLSVGGGERFIARGGIIHVYLKDRKLAFDISTKAAEAARIKIDARLLSLAKKVY